MPSLTIGVTYEVRPGDHNFTYYFVTVAYHKLREMKQWCYKTFGDFGDETTQRWQVMGTAVVFRNEADRSWFIMRWS